MKIKEVSVLYGQYPPLERAYRDFAEHTLASLAGPFARLAYLASLRDFARDEYAHWGMENIHGPAATQTALTRLHGEVFREVSALPLAELAGQVRQYLDEQPDGGRILLRNWRTGLIDPWLLPPAASPLEAENFRINITAVLEVLEKQGVGRAEATEGEAGQGTGPQGTPGSQEKQQG